MPGDLRPVRVEPAAQLGADRQRGGDRGQRLTGAQQFVLRLLLQGLQQRRQAVPLGLPAVRGGRRQLLLQRGRRAADHRHLRGGDLGEDLPACGARLGEGAVRAGEHVPQFHQPLFGVLAHGEHGVDLPAHLLQGARLPVVDRGVRLAAARRRAALGAVPERQRVGHHLLAQPGQGARDALQVVPGRVLAGADADGVREPAGALELGGQ
ncbi:hypothetical protein GCM10020295_53960 [Streptomyces cinereospinus]